MRVPLFPLPSAVLFPGVFMPLYVFEARYRAMLAQALAGDKRIAMGLVTRNGDVRPTCGVGLIVRHEPRADGTSHILLQGECRARILAREQTGLFWTVDVDPLEEAAPEASLERVAGEEERLRALMREGFRRQFAEEGDSLWTEVLRQARGLGGLADLAAASFLTSPEQRQEVLETLDVLARCERLTALLKAAWVRQAEARRPSALEPGRNHLN